MLALSLASAKGWILEFCSCRFHTLCILTLFELLNGGNGIFFLLFNFKGIDIFLNIHIREKSCHEKATTYVQLCKFSQTMQKMSLPKKT